MKTFQKPKKHNVYKNFLPDVTKTSSTKKYLSFPLERVGMSGIETVVQIHEDGQKLILPAKINIAVDLNDYKVRGIHMSRLYKTIFEYLPSKKLSPRLLEQVLKKCVVSQQGSSSLAQILLEFTIPLRCRSLLSGNHGFRHYPIVWQAKYTTSSQKKFIFVCQFKLLYSSTCPCSAALSEDLQGKVISEKFDGFVATPHAQRSEANFTLCYHRLPSFSFLSNMIRRLEKSIKTPVQTMVKREDEQEFARLNAENLMFCEDAVRTLKKTLEQNSRISDYRIQVAHFESLHAHDAVATTVKGVPNGLTVGEF